MNSQFLDSNAILNAGLKDIYRREMRGCIEITFKDVVNNSTFYKGFNTTTIFKITVKISNFIKDKERHTKHL